MAIEPALINQQVQIITHELSALAFIAIIS